MTLYGYLIKTSTSQKLLLKFVYNEKIQNILLHFEQGSPTDLLFCAYTY